MVDQLHVSDRILQHILLKELKPTFQHVMNPNVYHLHGPSGVRLATQRIREILQEENPQYVLRVDIKSYYKSIRHHKLLADIRQYYDDPNLQNMLENIITNPIETPRGDINPGYGIALRGPLSQFFSGLFLKKLDDAYNNMNVHYLRFQDDILVLCKTKRQLSRAKRRMMEVLRERGLSLSRKKSQIGCISKGFNFLGVQYLPTRPEDNTTAAHACNDKIIQSDTDSIPFNSITGQVLFMSGGVEQYQSNHSMSLCASYRIHVRCVRRASK
jgi:retron-type reverse transcriptase